MMESSLYLCYIFRPKISYKPAKTPYLQATLHQLKVSSEILRT